MGFAAGLETVLEGDTQAGCDDDQRSHPKLPARHFSERGPADNRRSNKTCAFYGRKLSHWQR